MTLRERMKYYQLARWIGENSEYDDLRQQRVVRTDALVAFVAKLAERPREMLDDEFARGVQRGRLK